MRSLPTTAILALTATLALSGCTPEPAPPEPTPDSTTREPEPAASPEAPEPDETIRIGSLHEPRGLDNTAGGGAGAIEALTGNVYEGLFRLTDDGEVDPLLAEAHTVSDDGLLHTVVLRENVTFHDGSALTADDVVFSIERAIADESELPQKRRLRAIESVTATDDRTVEIHLEMPSISLMRSLTRVWIVPAAFTGDRTTTAIGTGPFRLDTWQRGIFLELTRFEDYWGERAESERVEFRYFSDAAAIAAGLRSGDLDVAAIAQRPGAADPLEDDEQLEISSGYSTEALMVAFDATRMPFDDPRVRQAVSQAIDDAAILEELWGDAGLVIGSMAAPTDPWYEDLSSLDTFDPDGARALLAEAGFADGFAFTLQVSERGPHANAAALIQQQLADVGVSVEIETLSRKEWRAREPGSFDAALEQVTVSREISRYGEPSDSWGYDNPVVSERLAQSEMVASEAERAELLKIVARTIAEDAASEWLFVAPHVVVASTEVSGYPVNGLGGQFFAYDLTR